jgi:ABC-2 type transport system ATP-binding protein
MNTSDALMIQARGLTKRYKQCNAVDGIDLSIPTGRIVGLIGPNGSGKTTTLKALLGLTSFEGEMKVMGFDPRTQRQEMMEEVCFIADVAVLPRWLNVEQAISFVEGMHPKFNRERALAYIARTQLRPKMKVREMSKGMIVQLHLALVMAIDAKLLVLDEPTLGLDLLYRKQFYQSLLEDYFDSQKTIIITTHQVEEVEHLLTDVIFLQRGKVLLSETTEALEARFVEVLVNSQHLEAARALSPIQERSLFGKTTLLFDGANPHQLAELGETRSVRLSDLFVATMKETYA